MADQERPIHVAAVASFRVPVPWENNSPKFDGKTPSNLRRFLRNVQTICEKGKITGDQEKKDLMLSYLTDDDTRDQWERLHHYKTGGFDLWVEEIEELFPELEDARVGTLERLKKICSEYRGIEPSELGSLRRFSISFSNEADKLMQAPASIDNGQLVDMYLEVLQERFAEQVNFMASQNKILTEKVGSGTILKPSAVQQAAEGIHADRDEEKGEALVKRRGAKIPLSDVIGIAEAISLNWTGPTLSKYGNSGSIASSFKGEPASKKEVEGLAQVIAHLSDKFDLVDKKIAEKIDASIKKSFVQNTHQTPPHMDHNQSSNAGKSNGNNDTGHQQSVVKYNGNNGGNWNNRSSSSRTGEKDMSCFYCWLLEHFMVDCPYKQEHIDMGYVKVENGNLKLGDNRYIPRYPESKSRKDRVDDYWVAQGKRKGSDIGRLGNPQSQMVQYGFEQNSDQLNLMYDTRDDELRSLRVQMMNSQIPQQLGNPSIMSQPQQQLVQLSRVANNGQNMVPNNPMLPPGWDLSQFVQLLEGLKAQTSNAQGQFVQTRTGAG